MVLGWFFGPGSYDTCAFLLLYLVHYVLRACSVRFGSVIAALSLRALYAL